MIKKKNNVLTEELAKEFDLRPGAPLRFMSAKYGLVDLRKLSLEKAREMAPNLNGKLLPKNTPVSKKPEEAKK